MRTASRTFSELKNGATFSQSHTWAYISWSQLYFRACFFTNIYSGNETSIFMGNVIWRFVNIATLCSIFNNVRYTLIVLDYLIL